jgi:lysozyme
MYSVNQLTCIDLVKRKEGLYLKKYLCPAGIPTIGYGNTQYPKTHPEVAEITVEFAEQLLKEDLSSVCDQLNKQFLKDKVTLNINQFSACVSFAFNIGFYAFTSSRAYRVCIKLNPNDFNSLEAKWLQWCHVGTTKLRGLFLRRQEEFTLYCTPVAAQEIAPGETKIETITSKELSFFEYIKERFFRFFKKS